MYFKYLFLFFFLCINFLYASLEKSVVQVNSTIQVYDYTKPWNKAKRKNITGSAVIIKNNNILTSAHVVSNAKQIKIKKSNEYRTYKARVKYISHQADLAILEVFDKNFFKNTKPLQIANLVTENQKITLAGYPLSSNKLLVKKGSIIKEKYSSYSYSNESFSSLEIKVDAKRGNSGGAILNKKNEILAIAMQIPKKTKNKATSVPFYIIKTFLEDIKDKKVDGFHSNSNSYQLLENKTLQEYYKIKQKAVLVTSIDINEKQLKVGDIILKIKNKKLKNLSVEKFQSYFHHKPIGNSISLLIKRGKELLNIDYKLYYSKKLLNQEFEKKPRFIILNGLVFSALTRNYISSLGMSDYEMRMLFYEDNRKIDLEEKVVWLEEKFPNDSNKGYNSKVEIVHSVNKIKVKNFEHFKTLVSELKEKYLIIDFIKNQRIIMKKEEILKK